MEEIREKLYEQENEIRLLKEIIVKGFKGIENSSFQDRTTSSMVADENETNKNEMTLDDVNNGISNPNGLPLPLPVPNLF